MPYWERYEAARRTLRTYDEHYDDDVKVIIVDDGSPTQPAKPLEDEFSRLTVVDLPVKHDVKNPCTPMNKGVEKAETLYIGLTNPETYHVAPILYEMLDLMRSAIDYVMAPTWNPESDSWHSHPGLQPRDIPKGTGFHHMSLMTRYLWDLAGGMDDDYRDGYCFDDTDFVMRLYSVGANFIYADVPPAVHVRNQAKAFASPEAWQRNKELYVRKWGETLNDLGIFL